MQSSNQTQAPNTNTNSNYSARVGNDVRQYEVKRIARGSVENLGEKINYLHQVIHNKEPRENENLNIDYALLSKKAYEKKRENREVEGFSIVPEFTTDDRVVYYHHDTGKAIIAFRGTDTHDWGKGRGAKGFFQSRGFRDVTSDIFLGGGEEDRSHRFQNAEKVTSQVIDRFGRKNVIATGHSLGGSQAMHVSNKFGIHAEVYNPHVNWLAAATRENYYHTSLHVNKTDPVAALYPYVAWEQVDSRYNKKAKPFLGQHGIDNFVTTVPKKSKTQPIAPANGISRYMNRPPDMIKATQQTETNHHPAYMDCSRMPVYMQVQYGCRRK